MTQYKSLDGMLGTRTEGGRMEGADESTVLWRHLHWIYFSLENKDLIYTEKSGKKYSQLDGAGQTFQIK